MELERNLSQKHTGKLSSDTTLRNVDVIRWKQAKSENNESKKRFFKACKWADSTENSQTNNKTKAHVLQSRSNYQKQFQRLRLGEKQTSCLVCFLCFLSPDDCAMRFLLHSRRRKKLWHLWHEKASFLSPKHRFPQCICTLKSHLVCSGLTHSSISTFRLCRLSVVHVCRATRRVRKHIMLHRVKRMSAHEDTWSFIQAAPLTPAERCSSCGNLTST